MNILNSETLHPLADDGFHRNRNRVCCKPWSTLLIGCARFGDPAKNLEPFFFLYIDAPLPTNGFENAAGREEVAFRPWRGGGGGGGGGEKRSGV